jgi:hypothetical protein
MFWTCTTETTGQYTLPIENTLLFPVTKRKLQVTIKLHCSRRMGQGQNRQFLTFNSVLYKKVG